MKKILICLVMVLGISLHAQTVKVAAAGNLRYVLAEMKAKYAETNALVNIVVNLGSTGTLFQQITNGADYDLFMAADKIYPDKLKAQGIVKGAVKTYAYGKLIIWSNTVDVSKGMEILMDKTENRIAIANPDIAPYGNRAIQCLKYYNLFEKLKNKIVYADNIAQAAQFAQTGNAEIGILALALVYSPNMKGSYYVIDTKSYKPVEQAMVLIKDPQTNHEADKFMKFLLGAECKPVFEKYGYIVP